MQELVRFYVGYHITNYVTKQNVEPTSVFGCPISNCDGNHEKFLESSAATVTAILPLQTRVPLKPTRVYTSSKAQGHTNGCLVDIAQILGIQNNNEG